MIVTIKKLKGNPLLSSPSIDYLRHTKESKAISIHGPPDTPGKKCTPILISLNKLYRYRIIFTNVYLLL